MGLIRKSLKWGGVMTVGVPLARGSSKKQRIAKEQLKATQDLVNELRRARGGK